MKNYKFSIITPTHVYLPYLDELWESIKAQTYKKWEWILYLNGRMQKSFLSSDILNDNRVKIYQEENGGGSLFATVPNRNIGNIKNIAFSYGEGDILVEADHDDVLTPDCLEELNKAFQKKVGFVYSDCATIGQKEPFSSDYGWKFTEYEYKGKKLISMTAFEPTVDRVSSMWFTPCHVRAWRRSVYEELGGHDKSLLVCDDLDLNIRTFLKSKMYHIPKTLYIYRITGYNSYMIFSKHIHTIYKMVKTKYKKQLQERNCASL